MKFMNEYDIESTVLLWEREDATETLRLAKTLQGLEDWANSNSDGWTYWPKPCRAARALQEHLQQVERDYRNGVDLDAIENASLAARSRVLAPVRAFLTRHGVQHAEVLR